MTSKYDKLADEIIERENAAPEAQEWNPNLSGNINYEIPFDCLARDIQQWILNTSHKKQPALAFAASLSVLSVCIGRNVIYDGIKGNVLFLGLAGSGEGKDRPLKAAEAILDRMDMLPNIRGDMASGASLFQAVFDHKSVLLLVDEVGHYFASLAGKGSNQYSREIMPMITKMYTSASSRFIDKSRKDTETKAITDPFLSFFGLSTERKLLDTISSAEIEDGSIARFCVLFGESNVPINENRLRNMEVPKEIIDDLKDLCAKYAKQAYLSATELETTSEYDAERRRLELYFNRKAIECPQHKAMFKPSYNRLAVIAVQWAQLIDQNQDIKVLQFCATLAESILELAIKKFMHLCADNEHEGYSKLIQAIIKEAGKAGITQSDFTKKTQSVPKHTKDGIMKDLINDGGLVFTRSIVDPKTKRRSTRYFWKK